MDRKYLRANTRIAPHLRSEQMHVTLVLVRKNGTDESFTRKVLKHPNISGRLVAPPDVNRFE